MLPPVTGASPSTARPSVDFPDPDSPTSPTTSPGAMSRVTPSRAFTDPAERPISRPNDDPLLAKCTDRSVSDRMGWSVATAVVVSGFIGDRHLFPLERRALLRGQ